MSRIQSDAVALANDGAPAASSTPPDVAVRHRQTGVGTERPTVSDGPVAGLDG